MATQKPVRILYQAKNNTTGLSDVKAQVYLNGVAKAVGGSAVALTELDAVHSPGIYELLISGATLTGWGVAAGSYNCLEGIIDSAGKPAEAPFRVELTVANTDDIDAKLGSPAGASVSDDIAAVKSDTAAIKVDLESGANSLANILSAVQAIQNNAGFAVPVPAELLIPSAGSNKYRIPVTIYNEKNQLVDPDSSLIKVNINKQDGQDKGALLTGYTPAVAEVQNVISVADVSSSLNNKYFFLNEAAPGVGAYFWFNVGGAGTDPGPFGFRTGVMVSIAANATAGTVASALNTAINTLSGRFSSSVVGSTVTVTNSVAGYAPVGTIQNSGFTINETTPSADAYVNMVRDSLGQYHADLAIPSTEEEEELIFNFSYAIGGLATARRAVSETISDSAASGFALQSTLLAVQSSVNNTDAIVSSGTFGNAAIKTAVDGVQTAVDALQSDITNNVEGAGFSAGSDSLHAISGFLATYLFLGGRAV